MEIYRKKSPRAGGVFFEIPEIIEDSNGRRYELGQRIGVGGNCAVYSCNNFSTGEKLAVKFQLNFHSDRLERFNRERQLFETVEHEHIVKFIDSGTVFG